MLTLCCWPTSQWSRSSTSGNARDVRKYCRRVKLFGGKEEELAVVKAFIGANTANFIKALDLINTGYGSIDAYLRNVLGLNDADFEILRVRYLL